MGGLPDAALWREEVAEGWRGRAACPAERGVPAPRGAAQPSRCPPTGFGSGAANPLPAVGQDTAKGRAATRGTYAARCCRWTLSDKRPQTPHTGTVRV